MLAGAQAATLVAAFIRSKIVAILLGPSGIGLVGVMTAFNGNISALASWGLSTSGVRLVAGSVGQDRERKRAAVRKFGLIVSAAGLLMTLALFWPATVTTFRDSGYSLEIFIAGMAVPCLVASAMWSSLLQADGHVKVLAKAQALSALAGLLLGAPFIFLYGTIGIAFSLLLSAAIPAALTWRLARIHCPPAQEGADAVDIKSMFKLGGGLVVVGVASQAAAYVVRLVIIRHYATHGGDGLEAAGYYQAAISIAGSLPAVVFGAMGTDFFPRVAAARDEKEAQLLSERQIEAGLLMALPMLTALLTMSDIGLRLLYDNRFDRAGPLLGWMIWGVFLRLLAWPLGYWMLARGSVNTVIIVESSSNLVMALLPFILVPVYGVIGAAYSFAVSYLVYALIMLMVSRARSGEWINRRALSWFVLAGLWLGFLHLMVSIGWGGWWGLIPSTGATVICAAVYFLRIKGETPREDG